MKNQLLDLSSTCNFWIYSIEYKYWEQYKSFLNNKDLAWPKNGDTFLGTTTNVKLNVNNIIMIYIKGKCKEKGFSAICFSDGVYIKNKKIEIYKETMLQKFFIKVNLTLLDKFINLTEIKNKINNPHFKTIQWFSSNYTKHDTKFIEIDNQIGYDIYKILLNNNSNASFINLKISNLLYNKDSDSDSDSNSDSNSNSDCESVSVYNDSDNDNNQSSNSYDKSGSSNNNSDSDDSESNSNITESINSDISKSIENEKTESSKRYNNDISSSENISSKNVMKNIYNSDNDDTENDIENISDFSGNNSEDYSEQEDEEHRLGHIPVMIILCKKFKLPKIKCNKNEIDDYGNTKDDTKKINYFVEHIKKCKECEKINNDDNDFFSFLDNSIKNFIKMSDNDPEYELIINAYQSVKKYNPFGDLIENPIIRIYYIDKDEMYNNCVVVAWATPEEIE